ncbi:MAG: hypothetical protein HZA50_16620 [Planctomycetes bacterium]|nr:hypothetical protein [Planctomycetota bacterium]
MMKNLALIALASMLVLAGCNDGNKPQTDGQNSPGGQSATPGTNNQPAQTPVSRDARAVLDRLQQAGDKYPTIKTNIVLTTREPALGDTETRTGWIAYQAQTARAAAMFRIAFLTLRQGQGAKIDEKIDYAFDGNWFTVLKHNLKQMTKYQVVPDGEQVESLKLGKGPFPVPFGQKTEDVLKRFNVSLVPAAKDDPANTDHLAMTPTEAEKDQAGFAKLDMWVDRSKNLPVKLISVEKNKTETTAVFSDIQTGQAVDQGLFQIAKPPGYEISVEPYSKPRK